MSEIKESSFSVKEVGNTVHLLETFFEKAQVPREQAMISMLALTILMNNPDTDFDTLQARIVNVSDFICALGAESTPGERAN